MALNALFTGASGLAANSSALDVVGNNLANLNTTGFKTQRALFQDAVYQTLSGGSAAQQAGGGANPVQVGFGVQVSNVDSQFNQGTLNPTGRALDLGIQGRGFFTVSNGSQTLFTRSGAFSVDDAGFLVDPATGNRVQRFGTTGEITPTTPGFQAPGNNDIRIPFGASIPGLPTSFANLQQNLGSDINVGDIRSTSTQIYDTQGAQQILTLSFEKTAVNTYKMSGSITGGGQVVVPTTPITFDQSGNLAATAPASLDISITGLPSAANQTITVNLGTPGSSNGITQFGGETSFKVATQDGSGSGTLSTVSVDTSGIIQGTFSNGRVVPLAQLAIAGFNNESGLLREGNNYFASSSSSGNPLIGPALSGGLGSIQGGTLEGSNVDIATEFAKLIIAQRGFQVNAQTVTAANEVLQEIANIIR